MLMARIERQRDEAEEERVKEVIRRMNEECEDALRRQWNDAEEYRNRCLNEMREIMRREIREEMRAEMEEAIRQALEKAEVSTLFFFILASINSSFSILKLFFFYDKGRV